MGDEEENSRGHGPMSEQSGCGFTSSVDNASKSVEDMDCPALCPHTKHQGTK